MVLTLAVQFSNSITLGAVILGTLSSLAIVVGVIYGTRYKVSYEAASAAARELRESLSDERSRVQRLEAALSTSREQLKAAQDTISRLESLPNLAEIVSLLDRHEVRAQERHEATVDVLEALVHRLEHMESAPEIGKEG